MDKIIAYCGLNCSECPAYIATQSGDPAALEKVAAQWREAFNMPDLTAESVICDGCLQTNAGRLSGYCATCAIRACAVERGFLTCAECDIFPCFETTPMDDDDPMSAAAVLKMITGRYDGWNIDNLKRIREIGYRRFVDEYKDKVAGGFTTCEVISKKMVMTEFVNKMSE